MNASQGLKANVNLKITDLEDLKCECGSIFFDSKTRIKKISALYTQSGKAEYMPIEIVTCKECGKILEELNPFKAIIQPK
ncbi:MAG: hypothetical protein JETCAE03_32920 [Ignavibacteriaceae bacterium]|jgi:hypothetical protein|nr:MAG: hypothetical protein JETCAE03_32920 [Ignavibacteriaceae bacterium]